MMDRLKQLQEVSWSVLLKHIILPLGDLAFGQNMMRRLFYLEKAQWWDPEQIARARDNSLVRLIELAYQQVPLYRDLMDQAEVQPNDIQTPQDLQKIPVITKDILRRNYPELTTRPTGQKIYEACTSGSTGKNFYVKEDAETAGMYRAAFLLALEWAGWQFGEPQVQTGMTIKRSHDRRLKDMLLRCHYVSAFDLSDAQLDVTLALLEKYNIQHLWGYPGSIYLLAKRAKDQKWNQPLRSVVTWGDSLYSHYRETIETAFHTRVFDTYGCAEGMQISAQCSHGNYHIHALDTIVECLDDEGQPVPPGECGNLVLTRLHPGPMPLIRYRIGDIGITRDDQLCACGRGFHLMDSIQGRDTDIILTPTGNRLIVHFFTGILEFFQEVDTFQVVQVNRRSLIIRIVPVGKLLDRTKEEIVSRLKEKGANDMEILIEPVKEIPLLPTGKCRFVVSHIASTCVNPAH